MKLWHSRISDRVKALIDLDAEAKEFAAMLQANKDNKMPVNFAARQARKDMGDQLAKKGVFTYEAAHFLHVCGVQPYNGCGCCEPKSLEQFYKKQG